MRIDTRSHVCGILRLLPSAAIVLSFPMLEPVLRECRGSGHGHAASSHEDEDEADEDGDHPRERGVELGEFEVRTSRAVPPQKNLVHFKIYLTATGERFKQLKSLLQNRTNKARDQVIIATRLVEIETYDDPELTGLRRRILLRLRRALPELPIDDVYISDFSISVQAS